MSTNRRIILVVFLILAIVFTTIYIGYPKRLPEDGIKRHTWNVKVYEHGSILIYNGRPQDYYSNTAYPRRNWGEKNLQYHWFSNPTFELVDGEGYLYIVKLVK